MDPSGLIVLVLLVYGVSHTLRGGASSARSGVSRARTAARAKATERGGHHDTDAVKRRAARQATVGYWGGEAVRFFPGIRHGLRRGWDQHKAALHDWETERLEMGTRREERAADWRERLLEHSRRLTEARERGYERDDDEDGEPGGQAGEREPAGDGKHRRSWIVTGDDVAGPYTTIEAGEELDKAGPGARMVISPRRPAAGNSNGNGDTDMGHSGSSGDTETLDGALAIADKLIATLDHSQNDADIEQAKTLGDSLSGMLNDDNTTPGLAVDLATVLGERQDADKKAMDIAGQLKANLEKYKPVQESVAASPGGTPEPGWVEG